MGGPEVVHRERAQDVKQFVQELEIIEVQTGSYFGEDDIVRFADGQVETCCLV